MSEVHHYSHSGYARRLKQATDLEERLKGLQRQTNEAASDAGNTTHDNASYEYLVEAIRLADYRLRQMRLELENVSLVRYPPNPTRVMLGCEVDVEVDDELRTYRVVGYGDADGDVNLLYRSPLVQAVMGLGPGESGRFHIGKTETRVLVAAVRALPSDFDADKA